MGESGDHPGIWVRDDIAHDADTYLPHRDQNCSGCEPADSNDED